MEAVAVNPSSNFSLYVGNLSPDVNEQHLWETFSVIGNVASVKICRDCVTRRSLCYGYVNFTSAESAEQAHRELNFTLIKGRPCRVMRSQRDPLKRKNGEGNLMVKNLAKNVTDRQLYEAFSQFGTVLSCKISKDNSTGESRGFGFVQFEDEDVSKHVQEVNSVLVNGVKVEIIPFIRKSERTPHEVPVTNLYVKNFPKSWTEEILTSLFSTFGEITSLALSRDSKDRPFGFVNFADPESAEEAIHDIDGKICTETGIKRVEDETEEEKQVLRLDEDGLTKDDANEALLRIYVSRAQSKFERESALRSKFEQKIATRVDSSSSGVVLYVKNLPDDKDDAYLKELFSPCGTVLTTYVMRDPKGTSRGFGFVTMQTKDEATRAISELHSRLINGKPLFVCLHEKKDTRRQRLAEEFSRPRMYPGYQGASQTMLNPNASMINRPQNMGYNARNPRRPFVQPSHPQMINQMAIPTQQHFQIMMQQQQIFQQQQQQQQQNFVINQIKNGAINQLDENQRRQLLGEHIYSRVHQHHPAEAAKVTGMMLEMDHHDIVAMIQDENRLNAKINEALAVLESAARQ